MATVSNRLAVLMAERQMHSVADLGRQAGVSRRILDKLWHKREVESIKLNSLIRICDALGVRLSDLVEYLPEPDKAHSGRGEAG